MVYKEVIAALFAVFVIARAAHPLISQPEPLGPDPPTCGSYSSLCHIAYNISMLSMVGSSALSTVFLGLDEAYKVVHSTQQVCRCPGTQKCETNWFSTENSIKKNLEIGGMDMTVKMSYCNLRQASRICRQNEPAIILRGRSPFEFKIFQDFSCRCYRSLYAHRSWREGDYNYIHYSCGKSRCARNRHPTGQCTRVTYQGSQYDLAHDYLCRCRRSEECKGDIPTEQSPEMFHTCQRRAYNQIDWDLEKRNRRKRHGHRNHRNMKN